MALDSVNQQESFAFLQQSSFCEVTLSFRDSNFLTWLLFLSLTYSQLRLSRMTISKSFHYIHGCTLCVGKKALEHDVVELQFSEK